MRNREYRPSLLNGCLASIEHAVARYAARGRNRVAQWRRGGGENRKKRQSSVKHRGRVKAPCCFIHGWARPNAVAGDAANIRRTRDSRAACYALYLCLLACVPRADSTR